MSEPRKTPADAAELTELEELEELPELPEEAQAAEGAPPRRPRTSGGAGAGPGPGQLRELEQAPLHLRKAALVVAVFSLIPWNGQGATIGLSLAAKAVVLAAVYVWWASVALAAGEEKKVPGFLAALGKNPKVLWGLAAVIAIVGLGPWIDGGNAFRGAAEKGMMGWAAATWVHIYSYERGGKFNPLFPLMFFAPAIGGVLAAIGRFRASDWLALVGAAGVAIGGFLAVYTIVEAMKQAKAHGDAKRKEALAARRRGRQGRAR